MNSTELTIIDQLTPDSVGIIHYNGERLVKHAGIIYRLPHSWPFGINPFNYSPVQPFRWEITKRRAAGHKPPRKILVDANGVPLTQDHRIKRVAVIPYDKFRKFAATLFQAGEGGYSGLRKQRVHKLYNVLLDAMKDRSEYANYFDDNGSPKAETIHLFFAAAFQRLMAQPEFAMALFGDIVKKLKRNTLEAYEYCCRVFGSQTPILIQQLNQFHSTGGKLNVFLNEEEAADAQLIDATVVEAKKGETQKKQQTDFTI